MAWTAINVTLDKILKCSYPDKLKRAVGFPDVKVHHWQVDTTVTQTYEAYTLMDSGITEDMILLGFECVGSPALSCGAMGASVPVGWGVELLVKDIAVLHFQQKGMSQVMKFNSAHIDLHGLNLEEDDQLTLAFWSDGSQTGAITWSQAFDFKLFYLEKA